MTRFRIFLILPLLAAVPARAQVSFSNTFAASAASISINNSLSEIWGYFCIDSAGAEVFGTYPTLANPSVITFSPPTSNSGTCTVYGSNGAVPGSVSSGASPASVPNWITQVKNKPFADVREYNFLPQRPGGSLAATVLSTKTMSPCPVGLNGSDSRHYLYISGGSGTAEAVMISGGTCVSGAISGTVRFTPANNHSGAYQIGSASSGLAEAIIANGGGSRIEFPGGDYVMYAPVNISGINNLTIRGSGIGTTRVHINSTTADWITWTSRTSFFHISDIRVISDVVRTDGWVLRGSCAYTSDCYLLHSYIENMDVRNQVNGFWFAQFNFVSITQVNLLDFVAGGGSSIGVKAGQTASSPINQGAGLTFYNTNIYSFDTGNGSNPTLGYGLWIEDCDAVTTNLLGIGNVINNNVVIKANAWGSHNHFFDTLVSDATKTGAGVRITGSGGAGALTELFFKNCWFATAGGAAGGSGSPAGVLIDQGGRDFVIQNSTFFNNRGNGLRAVLSVGGAGLHLSTNTFAFNGQAGVTGQLDSIYLDVPVNQPAGFITGNMDNGGNPGGAFSLRTSASTNILDLGTNSWALGQSFGIQPRSGVVLTATSGAVGGSALTAGQCSSTATSVIGAVVGMTVVTTPNSYPGDSFFWKSYVSAPDTVTTKICAAAAGTPTLSGYYLRVQL